MTLTRIRIDVPATAARTERVEREVFAELAALRVADRHAQVAPRQRRIWIVPLAACVAAAALVIVVLLGRDRSTPDAAAPSLVETPIGGSSRFTVGDAVIQAGGDTSVAVNTTGDAVVLRLGRGTIDCEVAPRHGRPPFKVVAGDVEVEVVGTRFVVTRAGTGARVDVTRGKVRVRSPNEERLLTPGESWTPPTSAAASLPEPAPTEATPPAETHVEPAAVAPSRPAPIPQRTSRDAFKTAQLLEATDRRKAARAYREIASGRDSWAALSLYSLAELTAASDPGESLRALDELARRFPDGANAEDAAWLRVDVLRRAGRADDARIAAQTYLVAFPHGVYAVSAAAVAHPR